MFIIFNGDNFREIVELIPASAVLKYYLGSIVEGKGFSFSKTEFCMILIQIRKMRPKSSLVEYMREVAKSQQADFETHYENIKREVERYSLF
jgi:hypothetical protein